jgi:predicted lysophospholipase L1 biosynthesis ABC-type transport system permease subunit
MSATQRRSRALLAVLGVFAASLVVGTSATVGYGLATGFDRAAREADLPDVIARFDDESRATVDQRVRALPNVAARSYRHEEKNVELRANGHETPKGLLHITVGGRRGYAVTEGRDLRGRDEVVVERGLAAEWDLAPGDRMLMFGGWPVRIVGVAVEPDNVAFPLTVTPRVYASEASWDRPVSVNLAQLWLADPRRADITLAQARANTFGIGGLEFVTRTGIEVLLGQAAGIVIALLVGFSLVALVAAGTMLAAGAHAQVQRRLAAFGVQRALGFTPGRLAARQALEAALLAAPAAALGLAAGALAVAGPSAALLAQLNELPPGTALLPLLALCLIAITAVVTAAATWPAWRAARRAPAQVLRGGDLARRERRHARASAFDGLLATGARFSAAARGRFAASVATIAVCSGLVTLMLALAGMFERLRDDPGALGKRYQLTVRLNPFEVDAVKAIPGVADAAERYQADVADSYRLGEPLRMIAYTGDHTRFAAFLGVLATVLRAIALAVGLVCLYALVQALAMVARERRGAVALLRACGGDGPTVATVLAGAALAVAVPAAIAGLLLEWLVLGPLVARLAAGYATLPLAPSAGQVGLVLAGVAVIAAVATSVVARRTMREPAIAGLREE